MPPAARITSPTAPPGVAAGPSVPTVLIGGLPAAVATDIHVSSLSIPPTPFPRGSTSVLIGGRPALRVGDVSGSGAAIVAGVPNVLIGG